MDTIISDQYFPFLVKFPPNLSRVHSESDCQCIVIVTLLKNAGFSLRRKITVKKATERETEREKDRDKEPLEND